MKAQGVKIQGVKLQPPSINSKETSLPAVRNLPSNVPSRAVVPNEVVPVKKNIPSTEVALPANEVAVGRTPSIAVETEFDTKEKKSIFSIFNIFKKKETYTEEDRAKHVCEFYNSIIKGHTNDLDISFLGCDDDYKAVHYKGMYNKCMLLLEFPLDLNAASLRTFLSDFVAERDFTQNYLNDFFEPSEVSILSYQLIYNKSLNQFTKKVNVSINGNESSFSNDGSVPFVSSVKTFVSAEMKVVTGILTGRGEQFIIDNCDLNALLKNNKGKRIRVEVLD